MRAFQIVKVRPGTPREMGMQYGRQAREKILAGLDDYRLLFEETDAMDWSGMKAYSLTFVPRLREVLPEITEEAEGIAEGAGVDLADIMLLNCRYEITKFPDPDKADKERANECTSFALLPEATAERKTLVGQNWDYRAGIIDNVVVVHMEQPDGTRILGLAEAGQVIRNGFNSHGIGQCANNLQSIHDRRGTGIPVTFVRRKVLSSRSFDEAVKFVAEAPRDVSVNFMLASSEGRALDLEAFPGGADRIEPADGVLVHANQFVVDPAKDALQPTPRGERLEALLREKHGSIDVSHIVRCLSDHENYPKALCRHPADVSLRLSRRSITVAAVIYDLEAGIARICAGPPCEGEFVLHNLKG